MFRKIFIIQHVFIVLLLLSGILAAPFNDNRIQRQDYTTGKCADFAFPLSFQCENHWWIMPLDNIIFLPGFLAILLWPLTLIWAYVLFTKEKQDAKQ